MSARQDLLHLGVSVDGAGHHPAAWRQPGTNAERLLDADRLVDLVRTAARGTLDFVTLDDSFALQSDREDEVRGNLDALLSFARIAPLTESVGLIPTVTTTHTEPFHIGKNIATLDFVSAGRAGWKAAVSGTKAEARHFGRTPVASPDELYAEAADVIDVVRRLWDSWDDDAVIRDLPTGRYIDRNRLHYVDFTGRFFSVRGPSITPRSPQAQPLVAIDAATDDSIEIAAGHADLAFIEQRYLEDARTLRDEVRARARDHGRGEDDVFVLARADAFFGTTAEREALDALTGGRSNTGPLDFTGSASGFADLAEEWFRAGAVDGFVVRPALLPRGLEQLVDEVVPYLRDRGVFRTAYAGRTLRNHFGLTRPTSRYAVTR